MREMLEARGYTVLPAANGREALSLFGRYPGHVQLLVTDVVLPAMSGAELARHLKARGSGTRVLCTFGYSDAAIVRHGVLAPRTAFFPKPFTALGLARKVREVLDSQ